MSEVKKVFDGVPRLIQIMSDRGVDIGKMPIGQGLELICDAMEEDKASIKELVSENRRLRDTIRPLKETIALADWALRGANMNMKSLEKKMNKALETLSMDLGDE